MTEATIEYGDALHRSQPLCAITSDGRRIGLDIDRWLAPVDAADESVLALCRPPVLDVGCGPGRFVAELSARGLPALGVDIAAAAVALTRRRGGPAVLRNAFAALPGEGRWPTILLMDGNIGIGGDPARLLRRMIRAVAPHGRILIEVDSDPFRDEAVAVRLAFDDVPVGSPFRWALVGAAALDGYAVAAGARVTDQWEAGGRCFAMLSLCGRGLP